MQTHYGIGPEQISGIDYDYEGPGGCQRKLVRTAEMTYVYHQQGCAWVIRENRPVS